MLTKDIPMCSTSSPDPEKVIFNFSSDKSSPSQKDLLSTGLCLVIPPKQIHYSNFMTEFELLYRGNLDLSMRAEEKDRLKPN